MLRLYFLGTGAYDYAKDMDPGRFELNRRRSSALLVDDSILFDCGDFLMNSFSVAGKDPKKVGAVIITHTHRDHFNEKNVTELKAAGAQIVCSQTLKGRYNCLDGARFLLHGQQATVCGYKITALNANHFTCEGEQPLHYLIEKDGSRLFYGLDGGSLRTETGNFLKGAGVDLAVLDGTLGDIDGDYRLFEHNNYAMVRQLASTLKNTGAVKGGFIISHLAPSLHLPHKKTEMLYAEIGVKTAYDGMEITV